MKKKFRLKLEQLKNERGINMGNVLYLNKIKSDTKPCSLLEMFINPEKRQETYNYYDQKYSETQEETEIFNAWKNRRLKKGR